MRVRLVPSSLGCHEASELIYRKYVEDCAQGSLTLRHRSMHSSNFPPLSSKEGLRSSTQLPSLWGLDPTNGLRGELEGATEAKRIHMQKGRGAFRKKELEIGGEGRAGNGRSKEKAQGTRGWGQKEKRVQLGPLLGWVGCVDKSGEHFLETLLCVVQWHPFDMSLSFHEDSWYFSKLLEFNFCFF